MQTLKFLSVFTDEILTIELVILNILIVKKIRKEYLRYLVADIAEAF
jgi:hypothetical protein